MCKPQRPDCKATEHEVTAAELSAEEGAAIQENRHVFEFLAVPNHVTSAIKEQTATTIFGILNNSNQKKGGLSAPRPGLLVQISA